MALLDGFKVIPLKEKFDDPYLTLTAKSLRLNRAAAQAMGLPGRVLFLGNDKKMQIAVTPAGADDENGVDIDCNDEGREKPVLVKEPAILKALQKMTVLERDGMGLKLTIKGMVYPQEKVVIFDLLEATETVIKPRGRKKKE